jgi:hypothetical protein
MDRFERLLEGDATDFERSLLDSAVDDSPSDRARRRTLAAMGVGAGVVAGAVNAAHAATATATAGASKGVGAVSVLALFKWLGTGALVGSIVAAGVATVTTPGLVFSKRAAPIALSGPAVASEAHATPAGLVSAVAAPTVATPVAGGAPSELSKPAPSPSPVRPEKGAVTAVTAEAPVPAPPAAATPEEGAGSAVVAEVDALDRARAALAAGYPREALSRLARHDAAFPAGVLQPEAVVLRVRALIVLGESAQARQVANRFIASHPDSAQAGRLRTLVGSR